MRGIGIASEAAADGQFKRVNQLLASSSQTMAATLGQVFVFFSAAWDEKEAPAPMKCYAFAFPSVPSRYVSPGRKFWFSAQSSQPQKTAGKPQKAKEEKKAPVPQDKKVLPNEAVG